MGARGHVRSTRNEPAPAPVSNADSAPRSGFDPKKEYNIMTPFPHSPSLSENTPTQDADRQGGNEKPLHDILADVDLQHLIAQRTEAIDKIRQALDLLSEAENIAKQTHLGFPRLKTERMLDITGPHAERARAEAALIQAVDTEAWKFLLDASRLSRFMDTAEHEKWTDIIYSDTPALTMTAITETFARLHAKRRAMFEREIVEIFRTLSWDRRADLPRMLGKNSSSTIWFMAAAGSRDTT
jgi:hypothetical protein